MLKRTSLFLLLLNVAMNTYLGNFTFAVLWLISSLFWAISIYADYKAKAAQDE